ncbi:hypothetical protein [Shewanella xiamenensis]|uniref:hypothetical protein n=1 Tax=Shewanella xiamenensis TaxID=332186 RepID=UPI00294A57D8|nr:hypothetical protein [Shewanella xiamenensis]MDV5246410.1 hypothetical protein [Shewanella xiamenensis]
MVSINATGCHRRHWYGCCSSLPTCMVGHGVTFAHGDAVATSAIGWLVAGGE